MNRRIIPFLKSVGEETKAWTEKKKTSLA